jgi:riboflavin synthase
MKYVCDEGSICINGVSLTINKVYNSDINVFIIPHTWNYTSLKYLAVGDSANIEFDILIKYLERLSLFNNKDSKHKKHINEILK